MRLRGAFLNSQQPRSRHRKRADRSTRQRGQLTSQPGDDTPKWQLLRRWLPNWWGIAGAQVASWVALGPSFLPRKWWMTTGSLGLSQLYGYGIGSGLRMLRRAVMPALRPVLGHLPAPRMLERVWRATVVSTLTAGTVVAFVNSVPRQREIARLVERDRPDPAVQFVGAILGTAATGAALGALELLKLQSRGTRWVLARFLPALAAPFSGTIVTFVVTYYLNRSVLWDRLMKFLLDRAREHDRQPLPDRVPPVQPERSGSAASFEPFTSLGRHGKAAVSDGPRGADIARFWAARGDTTPVREPVRAYIGLRPQVSIPEAARLAVRELRRAGGFDRQHLCIYIGTGTGWLNDWSLGAFEFLTRGDSAVVSIQYSVITSALAFLADRNSAKLTARSLYHEVLRELAHIPAGHRPKLYMSGESLGAFGALSVFADAEDMVAQLDGAVWSGTPQITPIWQELTDARTPASPMILPRIGGGEHVRFSNHSADLTGPIGGTPYAPWGEHRFVFMQHPSDPVVWWHPRLIWHEPQWMREPRGFDVTAAMKWWPWVTFWQVAADMAASIQPPGGHAHRYFDEYVPAWAHVLGREQDADAALVREVARHIHPH